MLLKIYGASASSLFKNTDSKTYGASTASSDVLYAHKTRLQMVSQSQFFRGFYLFYLMRLAICRKMCEILLKIKEDFLFTSGKNGFIIYM